MLIKRQVLSTVNEIMSFIAPNAGGSVPEVDSEEYAQWLLAIQVKYEEASKRGWWRRLLQKDDTLSVSAGDEFVVLPEQFQRANALYIFALGGAEGEDLADPDRIINTDSQTIFLQQILDPEDEDYGLWQANFKFPIEEDQDIILWYFATPPVPTSGEDRVVLPGDMVAFGAMSEIFRSTNLEGSQDDARIEYENRITNYLSIEMIPPRNELIVFSTNPGRINRTAAARLQWTTPRNHRQRRV